MSARPDAYSDALARALVHAHAWFASLSSRPVGPRIDADTLAAVSAGALPSSPTIASDVIDELAAKMNAGVGPAIVCLQAGNLHSGTADPMGQAIDVAERHTAWVHVDGAFGLWAAASGRSRGQLAGLERAHSWATDAHKTLNVPYDCGVAIVSRPDVVRRVCGVHTSYLVTAERAPGGLGPGDPFEKVPELSRRARGVPVWAALRSLGRDGTIALVDGLAAHARALADGLRAMPGVEVLNEVVFTQVCVSFGGDDRTRLVTQQLIADGAAWMSGSRWHDRDILRISVSNWSTDAADVALALAAVERACGAADAGAGRAAAARPSQNDRD